MKSIYNVAISCIGSGVGQSVINSCRLSRLPIKTFGFGTNPLAYGLYDCDEYVYTPNIYNEDYVDALIEICKEHNIDIIIPGMDDEAHIFAQNIDKFAQANLKTIVAGVELLDICRDKEKMSNELNKISNVFVKSYDKQGFVEAFENNLITLPVIAKPRSGFASRGIEIINSKEDISKITDTHIVQELAVPHQQDPDRQFYDRQLKKNINPQVAEISIQLVADRNGEIMGKMISYNKLNNGVPIEIIPFDSEEIWEEVFKLYPTFKKMGLRGPFNLQGRLTDNGLKLFELNARFTGITGLRAYMGFNEVEECLKEWLEIRTSESSLILNNSRFGIRQTADKSISTERNPEVLKLLKLVNGKELKINKNILISGATGYLGRNLIDAIQRENLPFNIWAFVRDKKKAETLLPQGIAFYDQEDFLNGNLSLGNVDVLLHAGFARPHCTQQEIAESLNFTAELFSSAIANQVANIVNISSQSVYGQTTLPPWKEEDVIAPNTPYGAAKYASELFLKNMATQHKHINHTSIRLGALTGGAKGLVGVDLVYKIVSQAQKSEKINLVGGMQMIERLDIRDAVDGIVALLKAPTSVWKPVYNLGSMETVSLKELADSIVDVVSEEKNVEKSTIYVEQKDVKQFFGLNCELFNRDFNWKPTYALKDTIKSLIDFEI